MSFNERVRRLAGRAHLPRRTVRLRLTLIYGSLFLVSGAVMLIVTNLLVRHATASSVIIRRSVSGSGFTAGGVSPGNPATGAVQFFNGGVPPLTPRQLAVQTQQIQTQLVTEHAHELHALAVFSGVALCVMAAVSIALGWIMAGRILRPLRTMNATARNISATNLNERLALDGPDDELKELGETFNDLLARLEKSFESQRRFVANASHELRSPLARQRTLAQVALDDPDANVASLRAAHERVLASGAQQERLIEGLLTLARGEAGLPRRELVDLSVIVDSVVLTPLPEVDRLDLKVNTTIMPATLMGDPRLVERLVTNLVDNAMRHNVADGRVAVAARMQGLRAVLSVVNDGPVIPPHDVGRLFQTFQRMARDRTGAHGEGVGLGLSIVQAIATSHGARIKAQARPEGGMAIEVSFPPVDVDAPLRPADANGPGPVLV